jgi:membrane fusion protein (multidrug efflux system)
MNPRIYLLLAAFPFIYACKSGRANDNSLAGKPKSYPVIAVIEKDTALQNRYVADIQARKNVEIHARVSSVLEQVHVDEGQTVHKGQLLFTINDDELRIALSKADAQLNSAKAEARVAEVEQERVQMLVNKKIVSATELDLATAKLNAFKAKIQEAESEKAAVKKRLSYTTIYSPFDGVIDRLPLKSGSLVTDGSLLTTISDIRSMLVYFNISENEYIKLMRRGDDSVHANDVNLILADGSVYPHKGHVMAAESEINDNTGSIAFRADFPNPQSLLKHGASGTLLISKPVERILMVPQKSVMEIQDKNFVYVVDKNNVVKMKSFTTSHRVDGYYVVQSGLTPSDRIIYEGIQSIRDGDKIDPVLISK